MFFYMGCTQKAWRVWAESVLAFIGLCRTKSGEAQQGAVCPVTPHSVCITRYDVWVGYIAFICARAVMF